MRDRLRGIRLRTMLIGIAVVAVILAAGREALIRYETRGFIEFHEARSALFLDRARQHETSRPDVAGEYQRLARWHHDRAEMYRRARSYTYEKEMKEDLRQTIREQTFDQSLMPGPNGGAAPASGT